MFSDSWRWLKIFLALALLAALALHGAADERWQCSTLGLCLRHPDACDARGVTAGQVLILDAGPEGFRFLAARRPFLAAGHWPEARPGALADVLGEFRAPDRFEVREVHVYVERQAKVWGSLAAALAACALFLRALRRALKREE